MKRTTGALLLSAIIFAVITWQVSKVSAPSEERQQPGKGTRSKPAPPVQPTNTIFPRQPPGTSSSLLAGTPHRSESPALPSAPVREYLPGLLQRASGPNPSSDAALTAFLALNACRTLATMQPAPGQQPNPRPAGGPDCAGITEKEWADAPRLLKTAADLGNEQAQILYSQRLTLVGKSQSDLIDHPEELVEFQANANRYLINASENGNVDAMWALSEAFRTGELGRKDPIAAYQYAYAILLVGGYPRAIDTVLPNLASQLTSRDVVSAQQNAQAFVTRCCKRKTR